MRFVCVSDTHTYHERLELPEGDVLIHGGDLVGNYGKDSMKGLLRQLEQACKWLAAQCSRFQLVIFVAGNHETLLDNEYYDASAARELLQNILPANCVYLENELLEWRNLRIWGSPVVVSRRETLQKKYISDAFERPEKVRKKLWEWIPEGLDVLITHSPPQYPRALSGALVGDPLLSQRLESLERPPRFHVFGHDHDYPGLVETERVPAVAGRDPEREKSPVTLASAEEPWSTSTVYVNAAQKGLLKMDPGLGGAPWVFDIMVPDD